MNNIISRLEEAESLYYIRKILIPLAVNSWNTGFVSSFHAENHMNITNEQVSKNLKKINHIQKDNSDIIKFECFIENPSGIEYNVKIKFYIVKYPDGELEIGWNHAFSSGGEYKVGNKSLTNIPPKIIQLKKLNENEDESNISKMEEQQAVNYINRIIIPYVIDNVYNKKLSMYPNSSPKAFPRIGYQTLRKNLRKIRMEKNSIVYDTHVSGGDHNHRNTYFRFVIYKSHFGGLIVSLNHQLGIGKNPKPFVVYKNINESIKKNAVKQVVESKKVKFPLSKEDEMRGLDYIRKMLVPLAIHYYNQQYQSPTIEYDVNRSMRKVRHQTVPVGGGTDFVEYRAPTPTKDLEFVFEIYHHNNGELRASWGFITDQYDGVVGGTSKVGSNPPQELQESRYRSDHPNFRINREEESRGLDFIRKKLIKRAVDSWNEKTSSKIVEEFVRKNLKKIKHKIWDEDWFHDYIEYQVPLPLTLRVKRGPMIFKIWKSDSQRLMVGFEHPLSGGMVSNYVEGNILNENTKLAEKYGINKMEEQYAVEFIKKKLIPEFINFANLTRKEYTHQKQLNIQDVVRTLKKIKQYQYPNGYIRKLDYQIQITDTREPSIFSIFKDNGKLKIYKEWDGTTQFVK